MDKGTAPIQLSAEGILPKLEKDELDNYFLMLDIPDQPVKIKLDSSQVRTLGLLCCHYFPNLEPRFVVPSEEEAYRLPARVFAHLDDRSIQLLLREVQSESLIIFLWYMKDPRIVKKIFKNLAVRAAQMLLDDLQVKYDELKDPDKATLVVIEDGRGEALEIMKTLDRLQAEGVIPKF
jgi:flagellar motor switch protein FliG